ncbi:MAG TPA: FliM/FliN family flagellar motor switch protein [Terracidiphilus sp.]|jgi:flagellar motor switch protein FliN/FliY
MTYLECWTSVARSLFPQALSGEPELVDSLPRPMETGSFGFAATLEGEQLGRFSIFVEAAILDAPLLGECADQKAAWAELLREVCEAAAGEWLTRTGRKCRVARFETVEAASQVSQAFQLRSGDRVWTILVRDDVHPAKPSASPDTRGQAETLPAPGADEPAPGSGVELLLDVELEATLRFGCREMPLLELLELGPGDVVQLDRGVSDPVDLIVGDKIVARGEVVLVNGNFGLRVTEVAAPRKRLESIRCLF